MHKKASVHNFVDHNFVYFAFFYLSFVYLEDPVFKIWFKRNVNY